MFAENLKAIRRRKNISQAILAGEIRKSQQTVSWYESGKVYPSVKVIQEIAAALDVSVSELIEDK